MWKSLYNTYQFYKGKPQKMKEVNAQFFLRSYMVFKTLTIYLEITNFTMNVFQLGYVIEQHVLIVEPK